MFEVRGVKDTVDREVINAIRVDIDFSEVGAVQRGGGDFLQFWGKLDGGDQCILKRISINNCAN